MNGRTTGARGLRLPSGAGAGFTLVEIMVVLVVVAILVGLAVVGLGSSSGKAHVAAMRSDLRNLGVAQQAHFEDQLQFGGTPRYASNTSQLSFQTSPGVTLRLRGNRNGWSAQARHLSLPRQKRCAVYHGTIRVYDPASEEGRVECN